ncbi:hypothetical protein Tco_0601898 [Tanacetum coccineum]
MHESPYDTESKIKVVKRFQPPLTDDEDHITFLGLVYDEMDQLMEEPADYDLHSMSNDESEEATVDNILDEMANLKDSANKPSDLLGSLKNEVSLLTSKVKNLESSLATVNGLKPFRRNLFERNVRKYVWKEIDIVKDRLSYWGSMLDKGEQQLNNNEMASVQEEQPFVQETTSSEQAPLITKQVPPESTALVVHISKEKLLEEEPSSKRLKFLIPNPSTTLPNPLSSILPQTMTVDQFNNTLFNTTSSEYSPTPPRDENKGKAITTKENPQKDIVPLIDKGGSTLKMANMNPFSTSEDGKLTVDEVKA